MTPVVYVALPVCNVEYLIPQVLEKLLENTHLPFVLSICDNASNDDTYNVIKNWLSTHVAGDSSLVRVYMSRFTERKPSCDCINEALKRAHNHPEVRMVVKMDHDYGVPPYWANVCLWWLENSNLQLVSPSVHPSTPKGMQYFSQGHKPLARWDWSISVGADTVWDPKVDIFPWGPSRDKEDFYTHCNVFTYEGIAGYCHCFTLDTLKRLGGYRPLTNGAVFGSEDADWSLRCGTPEQKGYIMCLEGWHWNKPTIGEWEDKWKAEATFGNTRLQWEEWAKLNVPKELHGLAGLTFNG